ncbi:MAG: hypothetical protein CM15mP74_23690 [Halieaceae bacterium]|nr:MAG: hypothetical protein CM15mP74_23690 [Halieaceae bacterium]
MGIDANTIAPEGGVIVMSDGQPTGLLHETAIDLAPLQTYDLQTARNLSSWRSSTFLARASPLRTMQGHRKSTSQHSGPWRAWDLAMRLYSMVYASMRAR